MSEERSEYRTRADDQSAPKPPDEDIDRIARALRHMWHTLARTEAPAKALEGIQRQGYWVLSCLMCGPKRMSDIAETTHISSANLTGIVDRLEERGLVERVRSAEDRRVVTVRVTPLGRDEMLEAHRRLTTRLAALMDPLTGSERAELLRLLAKMTAPKEA